MKTNTSHRHAMRSFKMIALAFVCVALFISCATQRRCLAKWPPVSKSDTVKLITYRDTTVYLHLPADTIRDSVDVPVPVELKTKPVTVVSEYAKATAWIANGKLKLQLSMNDTLIAYKIDSAIVANTKTITVTNEHIVREKYIPKFYKIILFTIIGIVALAIFRFALSLRR